MKNCLGWINFYNPTDDWYYLEEQEKSIYLQKYNTLLFQQKYMLLIKIYENKYKRKIEKQLETLLKKIRIL